MKNLNNETWESISSNNPWCHGTGYLFIKINLNKIRTKKTNMLLNEMEKGYTEPKDIGSTSKD